MILGQAEVTRDEFGGYCCKRWGTGESNEPPTVGKKSKHHEESSSTSKGGADAEDNICKLLGLDIERKALEIVKADFKRKKIPISKAGKYLAVANPYSAHSSAVKSYNASASKQSATKPTLGSSMSGLKGNSAEPSAFDANLTPYKRSRIDSSTLGKTQLFPHKE